MRDVVSLSPSQQSCVVSGGTPRLGEFGYPGNDRVLSPLFAEGCPGSPGHVGRPRRLPNENAPTEAEAHQDRHAMPSSPGTRYALALLAILLLAPTAAVLGVMMCTSVVARSILLETVRT